MINSLTYFFEHSRNPNVYAVLALVYFAGFNLRYFGLNGLLYLILYKWSGKAFERYHVQGTKRYLPNQLWQEAKEGLKANVTFTAVSLMSHWLIFNEYTQLYLEVGTFGLWYTIAAPVFLLVAYDAYFYWVHYLLHKPKLFRRVHAVHHRFKNPLPLADLALHPAEAFAYAVFVPVVIVVMPMHYSALIILAVGLIIGNVFGHIGFEFFPRRITTSWWGRHITFMVFHNFHHSEVTGNYGFFFRYWDQWNGTELPAYRHWLSGGTQQKDASEATKTKISA